VAGVSVLHHSAAVCEASAATTNGSVAAARDTAKMRRCSPANPHTCALTPLSVRTFSKLGKPTMQLLNELAETAASAWLTC
jgi:hypothetical protein